MLLDKLTRLLDVVIHHLMESVDRVLIQDHTLIRLHVLGASELDRSILDRHQSDEVAVVFHGLEWHLG